VAIDDVLTRFLSARTVYGEPYERDGVTIVPAAVVYGGGGLGVGNRHLKEGGGFGVVARPAGAFVISGGEVRWQPAVDVTRLALALVLGGVLLFRRSQQREKA
jgi:uncharacterized spore protein YtfJ